jgi:hypothetical protein
MNAANYAGHVGVVPSAISAAIARGEIVPNASGMIDVAQANANFGRRRSLRAEERAESRKAVARREQAIVTRTAAMQMRRKAGQMRTRLADRTSATDEINRMISALHIELAEHCPSDPLMRETVAGIRRDVGDLATEGTKIIRL